MSESVSICGIFEFVDCLNVSVDVLDKTFIFQSDLFRLEISFPRINAAAIGNSIGWPLVDAPTNSVQFYEDPETQWGYITKYDNNSKEAKEISVKKIYYFAASFSKCRKQREIITGVPFGL